MLPDFRKQRERVTSTLYNTEHSRVHLMAKFQEQSLILSVHCVVSGWNPCHFTELKFRHLNPQLSWFLTQFNTISLWRILHSTLLITSHKQVTFRWPVSAGPTARKQVQKSVKSAIMPSFLCCSVYGLHKRDWVPMKNWRAADTSGAMQPITVGLMNSWALEKKALHKWVMNPGKVGLKF